MDRFRAANPLDHSVDVKEACKWTYGYVMRRHFGAFFAHDSPFHVHIVFRSPELPGEFQLVDSVRWVVVPLALDLLSCRSRQGQDSGQGPIHVKSLLLELIASSCLATFHRALFSS